MKAKVSEEYPIIEKLEYKFLVDGDIYALNTLMSLLQDKKFLYYSKSSFYIKDYVFKNLRKYFWNLRDIDQVIDSLDNLIGPYINRYEYIISIKAQYKAFRDKKAIDKLEYILVKEFGIGFLVESMNLSYNRNDPRIEAISHEIKKNVYDDKDFVSKLTRDVKAFSDLCIKDKIYNIDTSTDKQLSFDQYSYYTEDITSDQSKKMYDKTLTYLYKAVVDTSAEYYFRGLIRDVFRRYQ
ncbi:MAG: hypothetical protein SOU08_04100 [Anaerococcus sp.]|nr:hypothetical protein [Anaerococcus sp.]MDD7044124.1 hypothetical protein [Peptoniphilaceae bacterium]MDY2918805.1 hypothetical protein [Anaerococcus sp.]